MNILFSKDDCTNKLVLKLADFGFARYFNKDMVSDDGYLICQPNNRIFWRDSNWITKDFTIDKKLIKVDHELISVESFSDKWVSSDGNSFYYDINKIEKRN
jgi:serine/threonine protein kinase